MKTRTGIAACALLVIANLAEATVQTVYTYRVLVIPDSWGSMQVETELAPHAHARSGTRVVLSGERWSRQFDLPLQFQLYRLRTFYDEGSEVR